MAFLVKAHTSSQARPLRFHRSKVSRPTSSPTSTKFLEVPGLLPRAQRRPPVLPHQWLRRDMVARPRRSTAELIRARTEKIKAGTAIQIALIYFKIALLVLQQPHWDPIRLLQGPLVPTRRSTAEFSRARTEGHADHQPITLLATFWHHHRLLRDMTSPLHSSMELKVVALGVRGPRVLAPPRRFLLWRTRSALSA